MKIFLRRPALYHFEKTVLKPGVNEITKEIFEKMKRNPMVLRDFERGILEVENSELEKPKKTKKKKTKKVQRDTPAGEVSAMPDSPESE